MSETVDYSLDETRKRLLICLILLIAVSVSYLILSRFVLTPAPFGELASLAKDSDYFEDFDDGESVLENIGLDYVDGSVRHSERVRCLVPGIIANNFEYSVDMRTESPGKRNWNVAGPMFRFNEDGRYYFVIIGQDLTLKLQRQAVLRAQSAVKSVDVSECLNRNADGDPSIAEWNTVKVKYLDGNIDIFVNEKFVLSYFDEDPIPPGRFGIRQNKCIGIFDNLAFRHIK